MPCRACTASDLHLCGAGNMLSSHTQLLRRAEGSLCVCRSHGGEGELGRLSDACLSATKTARVCPFECVASATYQRITLSTRDRIVCQDKAALFTGVAKVDLSRPSDACIARIQLPAGHTGGEFQFVPAKKGEPLASPTTGCCLRPVL